MNKNKYILYSGHDIIEFVLNDDSLEVIINGVSKSFTYDKLVLSYMSIRIINKNEGLIFDLANMDHYGDFYNSIKEKTQ